MKKAPKIKRKKYQDGSVDTSSLTPEQLKQYNQLQTDQQRQAFMSSLSQAASQVKTGDNTANTVISRTAQGASMGSILPGPGTAIGAGIGFVEGLAEGLINSSEKKRQDAIAKRQQNQTMIPAAEGIADYSSKATGGKVKSTARVVTSSLAEGGMSVGQGPEMGVQSYGYATRKKKADGGAVTGPGTAKSDSIKTTLPSGSFVVPAENAKYAEILRAKYLGENTSKMKSGGSTKVALSNGEHVFTPDEVKTLNDNGVNLNALAPNATDSVGKSSGGIHIKKSHEGRFTAYKKRTGNTTEEALHSSDPHVRQMANFARNAAGWNHKKDGGYAEGSIDTAKFADDVLNNLGIAPTEQNRKAIQIWARAEGSKASNNPLATTWKKTDSTDFNGAGVKNFKNYQDGVSATAKTISKNHPEILKALKEGKSSDDILKTIGSSAWGTKPESIDSAKKGYKETATAAAPAGSKYSVVSGPTSQDLSIVEESPDYVASSPSQGKQPDDAPEKRTYNVPGTPSSSMGVRWNPFTQSFEPVVENDDVLQKMIPKKPGELSTGNPDEQPRTAMSGPDGVPSTTIPAKMDGGRNIFKKLGSTAGLFALGQTGFGLYQNLNSGKRPVGKVSPELIRQRDSALNDAANGVDPAIEASAKDQIELGRRADVQNILNLSGGDTGVALGNAQSASNNANRAITGLMAEKERIRAMKNQRADNLVGEVANKQDQLHQEDLKAFYDNQNASANLMLSGISNFIGNLQYQDAEDRQDKRDKKYAIAGS